MILNQHPNTGLVSVLLVLLVAGLITGLAISGADVLNPNSSAAEAQIAAEEARMRLVQQRAEQAAYEEKLRIEVDARQRELEQNLRLAELTRYVVLGTGGLSLLIVSTGIATLMVFYGRSRLAYPNTPPASAAGNWQDLDWRAEQIRLAREQEHRLRHNGSKPQTTTKTGAGGNGQSKMYR